MSALIALGWQRQKRDRAACATPAGPYRQAHSTDFAPTPRAHSSDSIRGMSDVLDQSEIDALLASVAEEVAAPQNDSATTGGSSVAAYAGGDTSATQDVTPYDFKRPERVSKDHIRALGSIHDGFARNFGATLSGFLRTIIDVRVVGVEQLTYSEFIHSLPNPTCFVILQAPPLEGQMCLEVSPLIVYPIIDRLLGGSNSDMFIPQRPLTAIEWASPLPGSRASPGSRPPARG